MEYSLNGEQTWFRLLDGIGGFNIVTMVRFRGKIEAAAFREALDQMQNKHPMLRMGFVRDRWAFTNEDVAPLPLRVEERRHEQQWKNVFDRELGEIFSDGAPLLRLTLLLGRDTHEVLICYHHSICDAVSILHTLHDLFTVAGAWMQGRRVHLSPQPLRSTQENLFAPDRRGWRILPRLLRRTARGLVSNLSHRTRGLRRLESANATPRRTRFLFATLPCQLVYDLELRSRAEGVSSNGALAAATLRAMARRVRTPQDPFERIDLSLGMPLDTRRLLAKGAIANDIGLYSRPLFTQVRLDAETPFWDDARSIYGTFRERMRYADNVVDEPWLKWIFRGKKHLSASDIRLLQSERMTSVLISNIKETGAINAYGDLVLEEGRAGAGALSLFRAPFVFGYQFHGQIFLSISYASDLGDDVMQGILDDLVGELRTVAQGH